MNCKLISEYKGGIELCPHIALDLYRLLDKYSVLLLKGNLGTGKTTLSQAILKQAGYKEAVSSPTFNLVNEYRLRDGKSFYHFDLYRIKHPAELDEIGFLEYLDSGSPCLIEWPELIEKQMDLPYLLVELEHIDGERQYRIFACS